MNDADRQRAASCAANAVFTICVVTLALAILALLGLFVPRWPSLILTWVFVVILSYEALKYWERHFGDKS